MTDPARESLASFALRLREFRSTAGSPSLNKLVELTAALERPLARSTISDKVNAKSLPEWDFVISFITGCAAFAREAGVVLPPELTDLARWDAEHRRMLCVVDRSHADDRLADAARADLSRRSSLPVPAAARLGAGRATSSPAVMPRQLPAAARHFVGRTAELQSLDELAEEAARVSDTAVIAAIDGTAGVGKTALAVHWAHLAADQFPDGQLYLNLRGFDPVGPAIAPAQAVRAFLDALSVPAEQIPVGLEAQAALYRSVLAGRRVLVVLDNARDSAHVRPLLPGSPGCLAVVTSRRRLTGVITAEGAQPLTLRLFSNAESRELLIRRLGPQRPAAEPEATSEIIASCARLPLALSIVGARAGAYPQFPLSALAGELRSTRGGLEAFNDGDPSLDVRSVFSWSYGQLDQETARLFRLLGLHPGPDISVAAAASLAAVPAEQARAAMRELARAHLVAEHLPNRFTFHDLLRAYSAELAHSQQGDAERRARLRSLDHYLHSAYAADRMLDPHRQPITPAAPEAGVCPESFTDRRRAMEWFTVERPILIRAVGQAAATGFDAHAGQLAWALTTFFDRRGHWPDWAATQCTALAAAERLGDGIGQARARRDLARAYAQMGRYDDAHAHLQRALDLFGAGGDLTGQAHILLGVGWIYDRQGRYGEALSSARRALELFRAAGNPSGQANALNNVGSHHVRLGNHREALITCRQALAIHHETGDLRGQADAWHSLGNAYHHLGESTRAAGCYRESLDLFCDLGDRYQEAVVLTHLGDTLRAAADHDAARRAWHDAMVILEELGHEDAFEVRIRLATDPLRPLGRRGSAVTAGLAGEVDRSHAEPEAQPLIVAESEGAERRRDEVRVGVQPGRAAAQ
ncbi:MAG TPA: tetratricopeptide repeat protein [Candidatus Limnocylindrales bacterium]